MSRYEAWWAAPATVLYLILIAGVSWIKTRFFGKEMARRRYTKRVGRELLANMVLIHSGSAPQPLRLQSGWSRLYRRRRGRHRYRSH